MSDEIARVSEVSQRGGPRSYIRGDGFQIVQGITMVNIVVRVGPHVSTTKVVGFDMEAAMMANWDNVELPGGKIERLGTLQFGIRGASHITSGTVFTFSNAESDW